MEILELKLDELTPYENNARIHTDKDVDVIAASIQEFGMNDPIGIWGDSNIIVEGHGRLLALKKLGYEKAPCIRLDHLTDEQRRMYTLTHNKSAELSGWDFEKLEQEMKQLNFELSNFGFDEKELKLEFDKIKEVEEDNFDAEENIPEKATTKRGDLWKLGNHFLLCGDATNKNDIEKLMQGKKADLVFTDPPYGMKKENDGVLNDNLNYDDLLDFNKQWIPLTFENLKENGSWYCWGIDEPLMDIYSHILKPMKKENKITFRNLITWDKENGQGQLSEERRMFSIADEKCLFVMTGVQGFNNNQDNYYEAWEPIRKYLNDELEKIGVKKGKQFEQILGSVNKSQHLLSRSHFNLITEVDYTKLQNYAKELNKDAFKKEYEEIKKEYEEIKKEWYKTRAYFDNTHDNMNNVWHFNRTAASERESCGGHATPKPIALCSRAIKSSSREGEIVLDVFGGSGSTLIACEQLDRHCYTMELNEKYCDVIIKRWETLTGKKATIIK